MNRPMKLLTVMKVCQRVNFIELCGYLKTSEFRFAVTDYHAFVTENGQFVKPSSIERGTRIWVDVSAFKADGSLVFDFRKS